MLVVATGDKGKEDDLPQWPPDFSCDTLCASNRSPGANCGHDSEHACTDRQVNRCRRLSSSSLLHGNGKPTVVIVGAAFSFDWGLVQPIVAKVTQVCSYDHSGIGWSD